MLIFASIAFSSPSGVVISGLISMSEPPASIIAAYSLRMMSFAWRARVASPAYSLYARRAAW